MLKSVITFILLTILTVASHASEFLSVDAAYEKSKSGGVLLLDVRHPDEWRQSGVAKTAHEISMHKPKFFQKLATLADGKLDTPIALMCATGVRSTWLSDELEKRGYTAVYNVQEGMFGSQSGPGWLKRGLPMKTVN